MVDVGDEQVDPAVLVIVGGIHAHAGAGLAFGAVTDICLQADLLELAIAPVEEQEIRDRVVRHEKIHAAVIVDVAGDHAPCLAE